MPSRWNKSKTSGNSYQWWHQAVLWRDCRDVSIRSDQLLVCRQLGDDPADRRSELGVEVHENVWSAVRLQGKSEGSIDRSAQMYSAFVWRVEPPGHDELRCVFFLINGTVMEDHLREQAASTPLGTVRSS
jgi:hypothetical protein